MTKLTRWIEDLLGWAEGWIKVPYVDELHEGAGGAMSARRLKRFHAACARLKMCKEALATRPLNAWDHLGESEHLKATVHVSYPGCGFDGMLVELRLRQAGDRWLTIGVFRPDELLSASDLLKSVADSSGMVTDSLREGSEPKDYPGLVDTRKRGARLENTVEVFRGERLRVAVVRAEDTEACDCCGAPTFRLVFEQLEHDDCWSELCMLHEERLGELVWLSKNAADYLDSPVPRIPHWLTDCPKK